MEDSRERKEYTITLDDDPLVHKIIQKATGINSLPFVSAATLMERAPSYQPVAAFFDVHLGQNECGLDAIPHCRQAWPEAAFFVVTADDSDQLIGEALASGANDFLRKPLNQNELIARFRARCSEMRERQQRENIRCGELVLNIRQGIAKSATGQVWLPPLESRLLKALMESRDQIVSRDLLKRELWGEVTVAENTLDQKISVLRRSLQQLEIPVKLKAIYKRGFVLAVQQPTAIAARAS